MIAFFRLHDAPRTGEFIFFIWTICLTSDGQFRRQQPKNCESLAASCATLSPLRFTCRFTPPQTRHYTGGLSFRGTVQELRRTCRRGQRSALPKSIFDTPEGHVPPRKMLITRAHVTPLHVAGGTKTQRVHPLKAIPKQSSSTLQPLRASLKLIGPGECIATQSAYRCVTTTLLWVSVHISVCVWNIIQESQERCMVCVTTSNTPHISDRRPNHDHLSTLWKVVETLHSSSLTEKKPKSRKKSWTSETWYFQSSALQI